MKNSSPWVVYIIRCRNGTLYTGITNNLERRFSMHESGTGAKFLRGKGPLTLEYSAELASKSDALKTEIKIKKLPRVEKERLIAGERELPALFSEI